jgi:carbon monoxide dehydrogenase subunit G
MSNKWFIIFSLLIFPSISFGNEIDKSPSIHIVAKSILTAESSNYQPVNKNQDDINITIQNNGKVIVVDAYYSVPAGLQLVWGTLTDFNNIPNFIKGVASSEITNRTGNTLRVAQTSEIRFSGVSFNFESVGEIKLVPFKGFSTRMISGNMSKMHEITKINSGGDKTYISYHADIVPNMWILKYIGHGFIETEARERLQQVRNEIIRRKKAGSPSKTKGTLRTPEI